MKHKYRVAFCGVFDLVNYGDHIFPVVFEEELRKRGLDLDLILFSNEECTQDFNGVKQIYNINNLEEMHIKENYDAIVVGGGELVHFYYATQRENGSKEFDKYSIPNLWMIPSIVSYKYNIKLLWNAVGVLYRFDTRQKQILRAICSQVDYISVRNKFSKESLLDGGVEKAVYTVPDTALKIYQYYDIEYLEQNKKITLPNDEKYIVFHTNRFITKDDRQEVICCLKNYADIGYNIVLLPLAYTHGDEEVLQALAECDSRFFMFKERLTMIDMMYILAKCQLYIGVSFHGAVTALEYGNKVVALDFMNYYKTRDLFSYYNLGEYYLNHAGQLDKAIKKALVNQTPINKIESDKELDAHFDKIYHEINTIKVKSSIDNQFAEQLIDGMINGYDIADKYIKELRNSLNQHISKVAELNSALEGYQISDREKAGKVAELNNVLEGYQISDREKAEKIAELNSALEGYQISDTQKTIEIEEKTKYIHELEESINWHIEKVRELNEGIEWHLQEEERKNENIERLNKDISKYCAKIFEMENNFWWKLGKHFNKKDKRRKV